MFAFMYIYPCAMCLSGAQGDQRRSNRWAVNCSLDAGDRSQATCKINK